MTTMLDAALDYAAQGFPVFPCWPRRKNPATEHGFLDATTDTDQIRAWWTARPDANVAIATGAPFADVLDVDVEHDSNGFTALAELQRAGLLEGHGPMVRTRSGGLHIWFAGTSQRSSDARENSPLDFKAAGGYILAPPSYVDDADGKPAGYYEFISTEPGDGTVLDWRMARDILIPPPLFQQPPAEKAALNSDRAGDDYAARTSWEEILTPHGWRQIRQVGNVRYWCRPGKAGRFVSASTRDDGGLYVFSTSTPFDTEVPYSKFGAYTILAGLGNDYRAAAIQLRQDGYGAQTPAIALTQPAQPSDSQDNPAQHSSWYPRDIIAVLNGDISADPLPVFLARDDNLCLLYRGKINAFIGESESGKTWAALIAVTQALTNGQQVLYIDFEDAAPGIINRLRALGVTRDQLAKQFRYIAPDERLSALAAADIRETLTSPVPDLITVDGVNAAMTMLGLNLKDNKDATEFSQQILKPLKMTGAAVLTIDHVTKDREGRGSYAIGAQAKRADIDGAAFIIEAVRKFGRGQEGRLKLTVSKDRPGHVRAISTGATYAGMVILNSNSDGTITAVVHAPEARAEGEEKPKWRPTGFMEKVSLLLEASDDGASKRTVRSGVTGRNEHIDTAIDRLAEDGYISVYPGQPIRSIKPYREISEQQIRTVPTVPQPCPTVPVGTGQGEPVPTVPTVPPESDVVTPGTGERGTPQDNIEPLCTGCGEYHHRYGAGGRPCFKQPARAS